MSGNTRTYPAFPIPAVGAIILGNDEVLLIQRGQAPARGKWTIPGGVVELGESPEEALIREIQEECHLDIHIQGIVEIFNRVVWDEQGNIMYHYIILDYLVHCGTVKACHEFPAAPDSDVMDLRWVPLKDITNYDVTEGLVDVINAAVELQKRL